jgi:hypothetical protein
MKHSLYLKRDYHSIAHLEHPFLPREVFFKREKIQSIFMFLKDK